MKSIKIILLLALLVGSVPATSWTVKQYESLKVSTNETDKLNLNLFIAGVAEGFQFSNLKLDSIGTSQFYCQPESLIVDDERLKHIIDRQIEIHRKMSHEYSGNLPKLDEWPVGMLMLEGLIETFPCK